MKKWVIRGLLALLVSSFFASILCVEAPVKAKIRALKANLELKGYQSEMVIPIHGKRIGLVNRLLTVCFGASPKSQHLSGQAMDLLILDVNADGSIDQRDVEIVHRILDLVIVNQHGGVGTCLQHQHALSQQIIHFDTRGYRARWKPQSIVVAP